MVLQRPTRPSRTACVHTHTCAHTHTDVLSIIGECNAKVRSQEIPGITGKFGLGVQKEAGQRLTVLPRECTGHSKAPSSNTRDTSTHGHHQMVITEIRLILFFVAKDGEAL